MGKEIIKVRLSDETDCFFEIKNNGNRELVSANNPVFDFEVVKKQISKISEEFVEIFEHVKPSKTSIEFGIELSVESGQLTSYIVKGSGKSNIKITLEWQSKENSNSH